MNRKNRSVQNRINFIEESRIKCKRRNFEENRIEQEKLE